MVKAIPGREYSLKGKHGEIKFIVETVRSTDYGTMIIISFDSHSSNMLKNRYILSKEWIKMSKNLKMIE